MLPEYLRYWGFQRSPFSLAPDPGMLFLGSQQHQEALLRLKYAVRSRKGGALLISDDAGNGKTSILRRVVADLDAECEGKTRVAFIDHPTLTANQMIAEIARQLGVPRVRKEKIDNLNALRRTLLALHEDGMTALVVVDEGQMLVHKPDILQELRILLNFCVSESFLLSFILSGQKPLEGAVRRMPEFWQRLSVRVFLKNVARAEVGELLRYRVRTAGQIENEIFTPTAVDGIFRHSNGCPRVICAVADLALLIGHSRRSRTVDLVEVSEAVNDMSRGGEAFHYFSFKGSEAAPPAPSTTRCDRCGRFLKATATGCGRCGTLRAERTPSAEPAAAPPPMAARAGAEEKVQCPACRQSAPPGDECRSCGYVLRQVCGGCQRRSSADLTSCDHCGARLAGRERLAARHLEEGLRRIGVDAVPPMVSGRYPALQEQGRVFLGSMPPRFFWGSRPQLSDGEKVVGGSFFVTERALVFAHGGSSRRIPYGDIRNLTINVGEERPGLALPRMRVTLADEELRIVFPVRTDRATRLVSLLSQFVAAKRLASR